MFVITEPEQVQRAWTACVPFRGAEYVSAREWMRICFELLELLKAHKKAIRRATVNTFGYIAKAIGWVVLLSTFTFSKGFLSDINWIILYKHVTGWVDGWRKFVYILLTDPVSPQPPWRLGHAPQQSEGAGASEQGLHYCGHRHCGRDLFTFYRAACPHERVPRSRAECAERRAQVPLLPFRVHWRNGQRLHLRSDTVAGGRSHGPVSEGTLVLASFSSSLFQFKSIWSVSYSSHSLFHHMMLSYIECVHWVRSHSVDLMCVCVCDPAETWSTDRRPALWFSTCLLVCTASAAKIPSTTSWTTCGPTCLRRRLTSFRLSWEPWKVSGSPLDPVACCSTACR